MFFSFVPYILFEIPSNMMLKRYKPHVWRTCNSEIDAFKSFIFLLDVDSLFSPTVYVFLWIDYYAGRFCSELQWLACRTIFPWWDIFSLCFAQLVLTALYTGICESGMLAGCNYVVAMSVSSWFLRYQNFWTDSPGGTRDAKHRNALRFSSLLRRSLVRSEVF